MSDKGFGEWRQFVPELINSQYYDGPLLYKPTYGHCQSECKQGCIGKICGYLPQCLTGEVDENHYDIYAECQKNGFPRDRKNVRGYGQDVEPRYLKQQGGKRRKTKRRRRKRKSRRRRSKKRRRKRRRKSRRRN